MDNRIDPFVTSFNKGCIMLESIYIGMTGLLGYSRGLQVIANNTANMDTPGFKSSNLQFADLFYTGANLQGGLTSQGRQQVGLGLDTIGTALSFKQGGLRLTNNALDLAIDGNGLFVLQDAQGVITYTRDGEFQFDLDGILVSRTTGAKVMALGPQGELTEISLANLDVSANKPTSRVVFNGNLSSTSVQQTVSNITVMDASGAMHTLSLDLQNSGTTAGGWTATLMDGTTAVGSATLLFEDGSPVAGSTTFDLVYTPAGQPAQTLTLDFSANVTSFAAGSLSTLTMASQDGVAPGNLTGATFDDNGVLTLTYANGQTAQSARLALARFDSPDAVAAVGSNQFKSQNSQAWHLGWAGEGAFGPVRAGTIEFSNVELSQEFSNLIIMQRGYQASSEIIATAGQMLDQLFAIVNRR
jgi:flagellar hook protein FlgE